jgi:hypothetical protein
MSLKEFFWNIRHRIYWRILNPLKWFLNSANHKTGELAFSIGIVTYIARYEKYFESLITKLCSILPDAEIIIMINGYYDEKKQEAYLKKITKLLNTYPNVKYYIQPSPSGLSRLWNQIIMKSKNESVFIFNDDIDIAPEFRKDLINISKRTLCLINNSWSHFLMNKNVVLKNGWFDERLTGVGNEDMDYEFRLIINQIPVDCIYSKNLKNEVELTEDFSYGKKTEIVNKKYSAANWEFFIRKWNVSDKEFSDSNYSSKFNLYFSNKPKLDTPNFYPDYN